MLQLIQKRVLRDLYREFPDIKDEKILSFALDDVFCETKIPFIFVIDEWDYVYRFSKIIMKKIENILIFFVRY